MKDLLKVSATQLFTFWKNVTIDLLVITLTMILSKVFPFYFSPFIALIAAALLYTVLFNNRLRSPSDCLLIPYALFYCMVIYAFVTIILNVLDIWNFVRIPEELSFFNYPFISALILNPVCFIVLSILYLRRNSLRICIDCKISKGISIERGRIGEIISTESRFQLINFIVLFGVLSVFLWVYYFIWYYQDTLVNNRDWYVFLWVPVFVFAIDEIYFIARYYNIYMDLKESGEIITEDELRDMTAKTYIRYYLICGNKVFLNPKIADPQVENRFVIDTPFFTKRNMNGITNSEVYQIIRRLTGGLDGKLRFFFGRKSIDLSKHRLLRYFYFLDGKPEDYADMDLDGEWLDFDMVKSIYNSKPMSLSTTFLTDLSRLITIVLTQKLFDERGYRKIKVKSYQPSVSLTEIQEKNFDFQDDKWIRISMFNSGTKGFRIKKWLDRIKKIVKPDNNKRNDDNQWLRNR